MLESRIKNNIVFVAVNDEMAKMAREVINNNQVDIPVIISNKKDILNALTHMTDTTIFISRGGTAQVLEEVQGKSVIPISPTLPDFLKLINQCNDKGYESVGILMYDSEKGNDIREYRMSNMTILEGKYKDSTVEKQVDAFISRGVKVIVGSRKAVALARARGMEGFSIQTSEDALDQAVKAAIALSNSQEEQMMAHLERNQSIGDQSEILGKQLMTSKNVIRENLQIAKDLEAISEQSLEKIMTFLNEMNEMDLFVKVIEKISKRINLLGLNAAIEASRSGQAGAGFTVVAGEVRKLAGESQDQVKQINGVFESIVHSANEVAQAIEKTNAYTEKQARNSEMMTEVLIKIEDTGQLLIDLVKEN